METERLGSEKENNWKIQKYIPANKYIKNGLVFKKLQFNLQTEEQFLNK